MSFDIDAIRNQFPALSNTVDGKPVVYFDNPAGTQVPQQVVDAVTDYLVKHNANTDAPYETSQRSTRLVENVRQATADFLNADPDEIAFGNNMTSLTVQLSRSLVHQIQPGDEIVLSHTEHDANVGPWTLMAEDAGATVKWIDINPKTYAIDLEDARSKITPKTKLVAVTYASNGSGTINEVKGLIKLGQAQGAYTFIDAVQYAPHGLIDVKDLDCDFLSCSSYKFYGTHAGILYGKRSLMASLRAYSVRPSLTKLPSRWEPGTKNYEGLAGLMASIDYLAELGVTHGTASSNNARRTKLKAAWPVIKSYEQQLASRLIDGLLSIPGTQVYGITDPNLMGQRVSTVSFRKDGYTPQQLGEALGAEHIGSRCGDFLAVVLIDRLGLRDSGGLARVGPVHYNTFDEIDRCLNVIDAI